MDKISSLEDKLGKCSTTLKTKETELNEILKSEGSRVSQIAMCMLSNMVNLPITYTFQNLCLVPVRLQEAQ